MSSSTGVHIFFFKNTTHSQRFPPLFPTCTFSLFSSPAPFLSQPAVQINNQALKWRKETSPMTARGKSSSNYTTKHCLSIFCLTVILLSVLLLLTLLLWHSSLLFLLLLNFNQHDKELKKHFSSFALHLLMWNTDWNWSILSLFSHHHLSSPFLKFCLFFFFFLVICCLSSYYIFFRLLSLAYLHHLLLPGNNSRPLFHRLRFSTHITTTRQGGWYNI